MTNYFNRIREFFYSCPIIFLGICLYRSIQTLVGVKKSEDKREEYALMRLEFVEAFIEALFELMFVFKEPMWTPVELMLFVLPQK